MTDLHNTDRNKKRENGYNGRRYFVQCMVILAAVGVMLAGCSRKNADIQVFQYVETEDGTVQITGLTDKGKADNKITIPAQLKGKNVTSVGSEAFRDCTNLREVSFEEGILSIAENAFFNCVNLETISFPQSLRSVGTNALKNTRWEAGILAQAEEIVINDILLEVHTERARYEVQENIRVIASGAFYHNPSVTEVILPESVKEIGSYAFSGCAALKDIHLPEGIETIGYGAFSGCTALTVRLPAQTENIGTDAFLDVPHLIYGGTASGAPWGAAGE